MPEAPYLEALLAHARGPAELLTVPGHKGGSAAPVAARAFLGDALALDVPLLIPGLDRPHADDPAAPAPLAEAQRRAAHAWGAAHTWFLTQGATQGNLAACLALAAAGGPVVVQRSSHTSTFNGLALAGVAATYASPEIDGLRGIPHAVTAATLDAALRRTPGARAVLLTTPTYHGTTADLRSLIRIARRHDAAVIVDESWGAHLRFGADCPPDALAAGADLVISSTHKHLGSLGGSAMLHLGATSHAWLDRSAIERALALVSSTSPSSLLMASLDAARARAEQDGAQLLAAAERTLIGLREAIGAVPGCTALGREQIGRHGIAGIDPLRLCIDVRGTGWSGMQIADLARREHGLELELAQPATIVVCFGLGEAPADRGCRLVAVLAEVARRGPRADGANLGDRHARAAATGSGVRAAAPPRWSAPPVARPVLAMRDALWGPQQSVPIEQAAGCIAAEALVPYPPGIPLALPGERLRADVLAGIARWIDAGGAMRGLSDPTGATVRVVADRPGAARGDAAAAVACATAPAVAA